MGMRLETAIGRTPRPCWLWLLPLLPALSSRLAPRRGAALVGLPKDIIWQVLRLVPGPALAVWSSSLDGMRIVRPDKQPNWELKLNTSQDMPEEGDWPPDMFTEREGLLRLWPNADRVATAVYRGSNVTIHHVRTGRPLWVLRETRLYDVQVFPDGDRLATVGGDSTVVIWDAATGVALQRLAVRAADGPFAIRVLGEMQLAAGMSAHEGDPVIIWHLASDRSRCDLGGGHPLDRFSWRRGVPKFGGSLGNSRRSLRARLGIARPPE